MVILLGKSYKMDKIYCKKCKFFYTINYYANYKIITDFECHFPKNQRSKDNWLKKIILYKKSPKKINKNNNCVWFEKIEYKDTSDFSLRPPIPPITEEITESDVNV